MKTRPFVILSLALIAIGLIPIQPINRLKGDSHFNLVITGQEMGCPCAPFQIIEGSLEFPKNLKSYGAEKNYDEIDIVEGTLMKRYNYEIAHSKIYIEGSVVGMSEIDKNYSVPLVEVKSWKIKNYIPLLFIIENNGIIIYFAILAMAMILLLISMIRSWKFRITAHNNR